MRYKIQIETYNGGWSRPPRILQWRPIRGLPISHAHGSRSGARGVQ